jgi:hypothetical protein
MPLQRPSVDPSATDQSEGLDKLVVWRHREACLAFVISALVTFGLQMLVFGAWFDGADWLGSYILLTAALAGIVRSFKESQIILGRTVHIESGLPTMLGMILATFCTPLALMAWKVGE